MITNPARAGVATVTVVVGALICVGGGTVFAYSLAAGQPLGLLAGGGISFTGTAALVYGYTINQKKDQRVRGSSGSRSRHRGQAHGPGKR